MLRLLVVIKVPSRDSNTRFVALCFSLLPCVRVLKQGLRRNGAIDGALTLVQRPATQGGGAHQKTAQPSGLPPVRPRKTAA